MKYCLKTVCLNFKLIYNKDSTKESILIILDGKVDAVV